MKFSINLATNDRLNPLTGDRIVAINGQNLLSLRYEDALKMLQNTAETIELVLSQPTLRKDVELKDNQDQGPLERNYLQ